jgi:hypothetical protein
MEWMGKELHCIGGVLSNQSVSVAMIPTFIVRVTILVCEGEMIFEVVSSVRH